MCKVYENYLSKVIFKLDPEKAHNLVEDLLVFTDKIPGIPSIRSSVFAYNDPILSQEILGLNFKNPVGLGGGFDRNGNITKAMSEFGFSHIDVGSITKPYQEGSPKPRIFRFPKEHSIQNLMGGYNDGADKIYQNLKKCYPLSIPISANLVKSNDADNSIGLEELKEMVVKFNDACDFFVYNVPTPASEVLKSNEFKFSSDIVKMSKENSNKPVFIKIMGDSDVKFAPDFINAMIECGIDGVIISHASRTQSLLPNPIKGAITGKALAPVAKNLLEAITKELSKKIVVISSGGIEDGVDAYERILLGADLIQIYSGIIFKGPFLTKELNKEIANLLRKDGFNNIKDAIGAKLK